MSESNGTIQHGGGRFGPGNKAGIRTRFQPGNKAAVGNPHAAKVAQYRAALFAAVGKAEVDGVVKALIKAATGGDVAAIKVFLDFTVGKPVQAIDTTPSEGLKIIVLEADDPRDRRPDGSLILPGERV